MAGKEKTALPRCRQDRMEKKDRDVASRSRTMPILIQIIDLSTSHTQRCPAEISPAWRSLKIDLVQTPKEADRVVTFHSLGVAPELVVTLANRIALVGLRLGIVAGRGTVGNRPDMPAGAERRSPSARRGNRRHARAAY